ncbi:MAG: acyclic terpene utilization AtuA family protein [Bdellovibrionota bacterium]|nr:acyclic terpene utilization AtuA family protein [Bdellovibrionota bacterium]
MTDKEKIIRIGCASAFWGDTTTAFPQLISKGNCDYIIFDFLAEVTMSILAGAKIKNKNLGYATDFVEIIAPHLKEIKEKGIKIISNAGGINLTSCQDAIKRICLENGVDLSIAIVEGDNLIEEKDLLESGNFKEIDSLKSLPENLLSVNAYLGAPGISKALEKGADIVVTGRVVDSALALGPLCYEFDWSYLDYDLLAKGSLAGHIIECGAHATGGNFTDWESVSGFDNMGFPIVEVSPNGDFTVTKPEGTGGVVSKGSVCEQFLYEIGNPSAYILPDVVCDFSNVIVTEIKKNKVLVKGAKGAPPTSSYKVSATYSDGFRLCSVMVLGGLDAVKKARIASKAIFGKTRSIFEKMNLDDFTNTAETIVGTESIYGDNAKPSLKEEPREVALRLMAAHKKKEALVIFSKEMAQAATGTVPGIMNFLGGRPSVSPSIKLFSFFINKNDVKHSITINDKKEAFELPIDKNNTTDLKDLEKGSYIISKIKLDENDIVKVPLFKLAFARSGDKGDHVNIGIIARKPEYLPYIKEVLNTDTLSSFFKHVLKGAVIFYDVPGIDGVNIILKNCLGGGGMSSFNLDPQGKAYAQQLLEFQVSIPKALKKELYSA